jgi:hypothetical protein
MDGIGMGLGFTGALVVIASVREILGAGTFAGIKITPFGYEPVQMMIMPYGAFITLGILMAAVAFIRRIAENIKKTQADTDIKTDGESLDNEHDSNKVESGIENNISTNSSETAEKKTTVSDSSESATIYKDSDKSELIPENDENDDKEGEN